MITQPLPGVAYLITGTSGPSATGLPLSQPLLSIPATRAKRIITKKELFRENTKTFLLSGQ
jgi:hypothetical protein